MKKTKQTKRKKEKRKKGKKQNKNDFYIPNVRERGERERERMREFSTLHSILWQNYHWTFHKDKTNEIWEKNGGRGRGRGREGKEKEECFKVG